MQELEVALAEVGDVSAGVRQRLQGAISADLHDLRTELEQRALQAADLAEVALARDAEDAAQATHAMLRDQMARLRRLIADGEKQNPRLLDLMDGRADVRSHIRSWEKQLDRIAASDLERLPEQVRSAAKVMQRRIAPVGVVYLWPRMG